jgi:hypothetical protein
VADIWFIVITVAFFIGCVAYVRGLDRMVRMGEEPETGPGEPAG